MSENQNPESHYNLNKLHKVFAIFAIILLLALGGLFKKDYERKWKNYQQDFRTLEIEKTRMKFDTAENDLLADEEYQQTLAELEKVQNEYDLNCIASAELEADLKEVHTENEIINQQYKIEKTLLDVARFNLEEATNHHHGDVEQLKSTYLKQEEKVSQLDLSLQNSDQLLKEKKRGIEKCGDALVEVNKKKRQLSTQKDLFERKLKTIDPNQMSFVNQIANIIRDLPILDMSNPNEKIEQIVLKEITTDAIFAELPRVDRCITCHKGIANADYKDAPQPFRTHPNLELFLSNDSAHPIEEFGCTVCHDGRGRGTSFNSTAHTPSTPEQKKEWEEKHGWEKMHHWDKPMLASPYFEAGCFKCHSDQGSVKGADKLSLGLQIIEKAGCYGCHTIEKYSDWPKAGPDLTKISSKLSKEWAHKWILDPKSFRHNTWMPSYFDQTNNDDPESVARSEHEVHAIVEYLFKNSLDYSFDKKIPKGNAKSGEKIIASVGCFACHNVETDSTQGETTADSLRRQHGPNLIALGSKTSKEWVYDWVKNPSKYHPQTRMPNLRLSDQEASDVAEYLTGDKNEDFDKTAASEINPEIVDDIVLNILKRQKPLKAAQVDLAKMNLDEKLVFAGQKLISQYGCYACHDIKGFEKAKPIGIELTHEGDKSIHKLDFGFIHIDHTKEAWFTQKLTDPRSFDQGKIKQPHEKLVMPNFNLSQAEIEAVVTALLGFVDDKTVAKKQPLKTTHTEFIKAGEKIIKQFNCQGCHVIEGEGGTIKENMVDYLVKYEERPEGEAKKVEDSYSPPDLVNIGAKLDPKWLFNFLHKPETVRPWLNVKMPTYAFNTGHLNMLVQYFNSLDETEFPFYEEVDAALSKSDYKAAEKLFSTEYFGCTQCHVVGNQLPSGTPDAWAPNLGLAKTRLNPHWLIEWIKNPAELMPGTKMPNFFDPDDYENSGPPDILDGNEDEQIRVLRNYLLSLSHGEVGKTAEPQASPAVAEEVPVSEPAAVPVAE